MHLCWTMACWGFFILVCILFPDSPSNFSLLFSVVSECLYWQRLLPASSGGKGVLKPLHASICQIFASTSSPAGLAAKVIPVMVAEAAATTPDAVAGALWQDVNAQFPNASAWGFESEAVK